MGSDRGELRRRKRIEQCVLGVGRWSGGGCVDYTDLLSSRWMPVCCLFSVLSFVVFVDCWMVVLERVRRMSLVRVSGPIKSRWGAFSVVSEGSNQSRFKSHYKTLIPSCCLSFLTSTKKRQKKKGVETESVK